MKEQLIRISGSRWMILVIIALSLMMHLKIFNRDLVGFHVWRQTQTQNTILSFAEEDPNIFNPRRNERGNGDGIFRMEFPVSQWITSLPIKYLGNDILLSRFMNFLFGIFSLFGIYYLSKRLFLSQHLALAAVWILSFTPLFYYYTINPLPDNLALTFCIWGIFFLIKWHQKQKNRDFISTILLFSLAGLTKLPFALIFVMPLILVLGQCDFRKAESSILIKRGLIILLGVIPILSWYLWVIPEWEGNGIVSGIFSMDDDQKSKFWYYLWYNIRTNTPELLIGLTSLPFFIYGLLSSRKLWRISKSLSLAFGLFLVLISALMVFEMNMIEKVHDYYFLPFLPVVVLISVYGLYRFKILAQKKRWLWIPLSLLLLSMPVYSYFRIQPRWESVGFNEDLLNYKDELRAAVPDTALVCVGNDKSHHIFLYYIKKKGWVFEQDWMGKKKLEGLIGQGCQYLYSDSRHVDQNPQVQSVFGTKVATFGQINVYKLSDPEE